MENEVFLRDYYEVVGVYKGIIENKTFIKVIIGETALSFENGSKNTVKLIKQLKTYQIGDRIGILRLDGKIVARRI